ncbi:MAG: oxygen-independent coproporphyrinogen III oxidase [Gammaproteobacteria bacterium]|nr:oxygen-independent coproporphyrinogen III oxidase [Gammaproteobacteria bacterium]
MQSQVRFDADLLRRYDISGPRYTSYPTALQFSEDFTAEDYREVALATNDDPIPSPLSLYVHVPFCHSPCFYCGCNRIITRDPLKGQLYLERLYREFELQGELFDPDRKVEQLHLGGGTPTFLEPEQLEAMLDSMGQHFSLSSAPSREFSIEIDPRTVSPDIVKSLGEIGFNRVSLGVQDFDRKVQEAINRIQDIGPTLELIEASHAAGMNSVNLDLIYGLPFQSVEGFGRTLDHVIAAKPDRLAVYSYAHLPRVFKAQKQIDEQTLPSGDTKLALLELAINKLTSAGYIYVGMDHFALPDDELVVAQQKGELHRNFQGYSTRAELDLVGLGMSSIGKIGDTYSQNRKDIIGWQGDLDAGHLPVYRGVRLTTEDRLRREIIGQVMCNNRLRFADIEARWQLDFERHFASELEQLGRLAEDGLIAMDEKGFEVTPAGRLLIRIVAMTFDAYQPTLLDARDRFSKVI